MIRIFRVTSRGVTIAIDHVKEMVLRCLCVCFDHLWNRRKQAKEGSADKACEDAQEMSLRNSPAG